MRRSARTVVFVLLGSALLGAVAIAPASFAAGSGSGTIAGSLGATRPTSPWVRPVAVAQRIDVIGPSAVLPISSAGRFRAKVPAGLWLVTIPTTSGGRPATWSKVVAVPSGRTATVRTKPQAATLAPIRIQVAPSRAITPLDPEMAAAVPGRSSLVIADLSTALNSPACGAGTGRQVALVEYRGPGGRFPDILKEVRHQQTRRFDAQTRAWARKAEKELKRWKPNYTLSETVAVADVAGVPTQTFTFRATNDATGEVVWEKAYAGPVSPEGFWKSTEDAANDLAALLCQPVADQAGPPGLHVKASATVSGSDADAKATLRLSTEYDLRARAGEPSNYDLVAPIVWRITTTSFGALGTCPKVSTGASQFAASTASGGAALLSGTVKVFVSSVFQVGWQETPPPDSCTSPGILALMLTPTNLAVPLGGTGQSSGSALPGQTFSITATVTPLTNRP